MLYAVGLKREANAGVIHDATLVLAAFTWLLSSLFVLPRMAKGRIRAVWREITFVFLCKLFTLYWRREDCDDQGTYSLPGRDWATPIGTSLETLWMATNIGLCLCIATPGVWWDTFYFRKLLFCLEGAHHRDSLWGATVIFWFRSLRRTRLFTGSCHMPLNLKTPVWRGQGLVTLWLFPGSQHLPGQICSSFSALPWLWEPPIEFERVHWAPKPFTLL